MLVQVILNWKYSDTCYAYLMKNEYHNIYYNVFMDICIKKKKKTFEKRKKEWMNKSTQ